jgi:chromosome segregation ATPase
MSDPSHVARSLRERLGGNTEERLGKALSDLLENPLLTGAIGRAFDAREKAVQAQEVAMGALNIPSAADIERLTRRLRSVSLRLEGIEEGVDRLDRTRTPLDAERPEIAERLSAIEDQLKRLSDRLDQEPKPRAAAKAVAQPTPVAKRGAKATAKPAAKAAAKPSKSKAKPAKA